MEKIPTAEESYYDLRKQIENIVHSNCTEIPYEGTEVDSATIVSEILNFLFQNRIEFAKMHVEAALKAASEKAEITYDYSGNTGSEHCDEYINKDSILNSYPLTNIK